MYGEGRDLVEKLLLFLTLCLSFSWFTLVYDSVILILVHKVCACIIVTLPKRYIHTNN